MLYKLFVIFSTIVSSIWFLLLKIPGLNLIDRLLYGVRGGIIRDESSWLYTDEYEHSTILTNEVELHYAAKGNPSNPLMLFVHGFPEFWYSWRHQLNEFSKDYYCVAIDLRGYNVSEKPVDRSAYNIREFVKDIDGVISGLGYKKCVLVAHDWGGVIGWRCAYDLEGSISKLIILNCPHPTEFRKHLKSNLKQQKRSWYMFFFQLPFLPELWLKKHIKRIFTDQMKNNEVFSREDEQAFHTAIHRPGAATASINFYRNLFSSPPKSSSSTTKKYTSIRNKKIKIPTLLIWGKDDVALGEELTFQTSQYFEKPTLFTKKIIPKASHWVQQDQPELVNMKMKEFLSQKKLTKSIEIINNNNDKKND